MSIIPTRTNLSTSWNRLWATAMSRLPGIGEDALKLEIAGALQEFLRTTHVWQEQVEYNVVEGQTTYDIAPQSSCADVTYIINVEVDGRPYGAIGPNTFDRNNLYGGYRVRDPSYREIDLVPTPTATKPKALKVSLGLSLKPESLDLPNSLIDHHFDHILDGILERAYAHPSKPYTNQEKQVYHHRRFRAAITRTRRIVNGGGTKASPPWNFPTQAPGRPKRGSRSYGW